MTKTQKRAKLVISWVPSRDDNVAVEEFAKLISDDSSISSWNYFWIKPYVYFHYIFDTAVSDYLGEDITQYFIPFPGTIKRYKAGNIDNDTFVMLLQQKLPELKDKEYDEIKDAWGVQSAPNEKEIAVFCNAVKKGIKFIFVANTNPIQYGESFLITLEDKCSEFNLNDHYHAVSYKSAEKHTKHDDLVNEIVSLQNITKINASCHKGIMLINDTTAIDSGSRNNNIDELEKCVGELLANDYIE